MQCNFDVLLLAFHGELELGKKNTVSELGDPHGDLINHILGPTQSLFQRSGSNCDMWYTWNIGLSIGNHPFWGTPIVGTPHVWNIRVMVIETTRMERTGSFRLLVLDLLCRSQLVLAQCRSSLSYCWLSRKIGYPLLIPILRRSQDLWAFGSSPSAKWGPLEL